MDSPCVWSAPSAGRGWSPPPPEAASPRRVWRCGYRWRPGLPAARRTAARTGRGCSSTPGFARAISRGRCIWWMHAHKGRHMEVAKGGRGAGQCISFKWTVVTGPWNQLSQKGHPHIRSCNLGWVHNFIFMLSPSVSCQQCPDAQLPQKLILFSCLQQNFSCTQLKLHEFSYFLLIIKNLTNK